MKKLLKILIGIVVVFVLAIGAVFFLTAGMTDTADEFFRAIKSQDLVAAPVARSVAGVASSRARSLRRVAVSCR